MSLLQLKRNPYLVPTVPQLNRSGAITNPRGLLVVKSRRRRNPMGLRSGTLGKTCGHAFGAGAAYAVDRMISLTGLPTTHPRVTLGIIGGIAFVSPLLSRRFPRLGPAFGGAMYFSLLNPLYQNMVKKGIMSSVKAATSP